MQRKSLLLTIFTLVLSIIISAFITADAASAVPADVKGFKLKSVGASTAELVWSKQKGVTGYAVYQSTNGKKYKLIGKKNYNGKCIVKKLGANSNYKFAIRAYKNVKGKSYLSKSYPVLKVNTMPSPVKFTTLNLSEERAYLKWNESKGADGYYIYYSIDSGKSWTEYGITTNTEFRKKQLKPGRSYIFGIKVYKYIDGKKVISRDIVKKQSVTRPAVPEYTVTKKNNTYTLKWKAVSGANEYIVYSQLPNKAWERKGVTKNTEFSFTQKNASELFLAVKPIKIVGKNKYAGDYCKRLASDKPFSGTLYTFGDSIAKGTGSHRYTYSDMFAREHGLEAINRTISAGFLCSVSPNNNHICQDVIDYIDKEYDYILIEGGRNDYFFNSEIGEVSPEGENDFDMNTVCGALEAAFSHIREVSPKSKVIFVMMHDAANQSKIKNKLGLTFDDYERAIIEVCQKYCVSVSDSYNTGLKTGDISVASKFTYHYFEVFPTGDCVHPSEEAYKLFYLPQLEYAAKRAQAIGNSLPDEPKPEEPQPDDFETDIVKPKF